MQSYKKTNIAMRKILVFTIIIVLNFVSLCLTFLPNLAPSVYVSIAAFIIAVAFPINAIPRRVLSLESMAWLAIGAYSFAVPLHQVFVGDYNDWSIRIALRICILSAIGFSLGAFIFNPSAKHHASNIETSDEEWKFYYKAGWFLLLWGLLAGFLAISLTVGFDAYFSAGYAGRVLVKRDAGPVELGLYHAAVGITVIFVAKLSQRPGRSSFVMYALLALIIGSFFTYVSFLGIRRPNYFLIISIIFAYAIAGPGFSKIRLAVVFTPFVLAFAMFANFRQVLSDHGFLEAISFSQANFSWEWFDFSKSELGAAFRALLDVIETWHDDSLRWGWSFIQAPIYLLPSGFGINVESLSQEYTRRNFTTAYYDIGGNMGFFPAAEGYVNFGSVGVVVYFALLAMLVCSIEHKAITRARPFDLILYAIAAPWIAFFIRTDFSSITKVFFYSVVIPLLFLYILRVIIGSRYSLSRSNVSKKSAY